MTITCSFDQVAPLCAGLVRYGVQFTCAQTSHDVWVIRLTGGY